MGEDGIDRCVSGVGSGIGKCRARHIFCLGAAKRVCRFPNEATAHVLCGCVINLLMAPHKESVRVLRGPHRHHRHHRGRLVFLPPLSILAQVLHGLAPHPAQTPPTRTRASVWGGCGVLGGVCVCGCAACGLGGEMPRPVFLRPWRGKARVPFSQRCNGN